ncbi:alpha-amylase family glycosyl hydrolase [Epilithonimonas mollis]|uniref:Por secretion system C-terminal sorting domain-containing protein n=1 Tax=Epilithonimonas mollis TaxID=216903 RepID=A0A1M6PEG1_9FLAO|nr:alpha-amylase family glycosyl hydrolase [Epilithonimonas mollis]SHK06280.1 Por secretion system C-terminal sorting domain-containing protein [Epilithonimonas mollis]
MKIFYNLIAFFIAISTFAQQQTVTSSISPTNFNEDEPITITFNGSSINESAWGILNNTLYLWAWSYDINDANSQDCPTNGTWNSSNEANKLTYNSGNDTYTITFVPRTFYNRTGIGRIGFLLKTKTGNGQSQDIYSEVGRFQFLISSPSNGSVSFIGANSNFDIQYSTSLPANYVVKSNGNVIYTASNVTSITTSPAITTDNQIELTATNTASGITLTSNFTISPTPAVQTVAIPSYMRQGISYDPNDPTKVGLALYAPFKNYVHVIGSFDDNKWQVSTNYLMKRDTSNPDLYWIEITGLTPQKVYTFQYRTNDGVKVADPYSTLVLSPDDDPWISSSTYPNKPDYPSGQQYDVSVIQTAKPAYNWTVTNFQKPAKQNLIVYEALVRDFTEGKNWQAMIDKIPYIKGLNVNAIELMPVMEFDGNNSWGYNPGFHLALDKAYGTPEKFKEFIDKCHQNGIAVILDVALNHASGRSPLERLWSTSPNGGYGDVAANNPYFNQVAKHAYSVFYDFNHSKPETRYYVNRVLEQWISEYKIDGFRWDLTKGFTQNCTPSDETCTGNYQQDRVDVLKLYSDYQWSHDPNSYIIFEHLGGNAEEKEWANYRINEGKGVMMWDNLVNPYNQNTMGYASDSNFNRVDFRNHTFSERRNMSYGESHDEERLMFKNLAYGNANGSYSVKDLNTALERQKAFGAVFFTVPGPKMIWQFGELGYEFSINRCENGTISNDCRTSPKPVAFTLAYDTNSNRKALYDTWAKILAIRLSSQVFDTTTFTVESGNLLPRIFVWNDALPSNTLKNVVVVANFTTTAQTVTPNFPYTGIWYNLMDNSSISANSTTTVNLQPGEFRIFGNQTALATDDTKIDADKTSLQIVQNPATGGLLKIRYNKAKNGKINIYDLNGKLVKSFGLKSAKGDETFSVNGIAIGNYLVQLKSDEGLAVSKLIIK